MYTQLGKRIRMLRLQKGVGLNEMATRLNVSAGYLSNLETGKTETIQLSLIQNLQEELNVTLSDFFISTNKENANLKEFIFRLNHVNDLLKDLNNNNPELANYLLSVVEQGIDVFNSKVLVK
ncbi:hypothetical protein BHF68_13880 [Desulfuribacillus alkaliarsenatis]|uniref:HTH cro/C1-type domain-containing protein n=2 Tax=Desulfuribacillus alkaliarsenatis TaxID=766136 RepID=A0A1E5G3W9_9FIRM|nr:hypothetical protein BHF68_13880 [Desulfuribacillus alkaliarsenatis]